MREGEKASIALWKGECKFIRREDVGVGERIPEGRRVETGKGSYKGVWGDQEDDYTWPSMKKHVEQAFEPTGRADAAELVPPGP